MEYFISYQDSALNFSIISVTTPGIKRQESMKDRWSTKFNTIQQTSMRHRSIILDSNDQDLAKLRLAYAKKEKTRLQESPVKERDLSPLTEEHRSPLRSHLHHTSSQSSGSSASLDQIKLKEMPENDLVNMLSEADDLDDQASLVHFLYLK